MLLTIGKSRSAEVIPVWDKIWKQGSPQFTNRIHDFEFIRGEDQFIMIAGVGELGALEIRETLTGDLITSFPLQTASYFNQIEITPDSNRFVITTGGDKINSPAIELRNIEDYNLINRLPIQMDEDSVDKVGQPFYYVFNDIVIDPIKPYLYAFITKTNYFNDDDEDRTWLKVYNYETMEEVLDLTPEGYEYELMKCMDISDDGKQLAVLNEGKANLKIWNTETFELTKDKQLYDNNFFDSEDYWCEAGDIEFSHIDNDLIYVSGGFPNIEKQENPEYNAYGIHKYNIIEDNFYKDYIGPNPYGKFTLFDNEDRILLSPGTFVVLNQKTNQQEIYILTDIKHPTSGGHQYSKENNIFLGKAGNIIAGFRYDSQTNIEEQYEDEIIISPNPTNGLVNITLDCQSPHIKYQINNTSGQNLESKEIANINNSLVLNFINYPVGIYYLTIECNGLPKTYKIVKEG
jgi:hypothetical protein